MEPETDHRTTVFIDADNTLWDTDGVFASAQMGLLDDVQRALGSAEAADLPLTFLRAVDQAIAERHQDGLRYPPVLLVRGLEKALSGVVPDAAARAAIRGRHAYRIDKGTAAAIIDRYYQALSRTPDLRIGVRAGLEEMRRCGFRMMVVSEAARVRVEAIAATHGILEMFDRVVEGRKSAALYRRMLSLSRPSGRAFMVGDQIDRDILPAKTAGIETIYFPGGFRPRWVPTSDDGRPDHLIRDFSEVAKIVHGTVSAAA